MQRRRDVLGMAAGAAAASFLPKTVYAQTGTKKLSLLTWNIIDMEPLFKQWFATFQAQNPGVEIEWLDKKGPELPAFYQTQLAAGTPPDIVDIQGGLGLEWAGQGALMDLTPLLAKEPAVRARFNPEYLANWVFEGKNYLIPFYVAKSLLFYNKPMFKAAGLDYAPKSLDDILSLRQGGVGRGPHRLSHLEFRLALLAAPSHARGRSLEPGPEEAELQHAGRHRDRRQARQGDGRGLDQQDLLDRAAGSSRTALSRPATSACCTPIPLPISS